MTITEFIDTGSGLNDACLIYKLTKMKGTKKAGYIWMLYDSYKKIKSK